MKPTIRSFFIAALPAVWLFAGCSGGNAPSSGDESAHEAADTNLTDRTESVLSMAGALLSGQRPDEALQVLVDALYGNERCARGRVAAFLAEVEFSRGMEAQAMERIEALLASDSTEYADAAVVPMYRMMGAGDFSGAAAWADRILSGYRLPATAASALESLRIRSLVSLGDEERLAARLFPEGGAPVAALLRQVFDTLLAQGKTKIAEGLLARAPQDLPQGESALVVRSARIRILARLGEWEAFSALLKDSAGLFGDRDMHVILSFALPAARGDAALFDSLCALSVECCLDKPASFDYAAGEWIESAARSDKPAIPGRFSVLCGKAPAQSAIVSLYAGHAYGNVDDKAFVEGMAGVGRRLLEKASANDDKSVLSTVLLDYAFILEDYRSALEILKGGIPEYDGTWHKMAIAKVEAHIALSENRPLDAIRHFRAFMEAYSGTGEEESVDPSTGQIHTKDMVLARNAKRIGDLYMAVPDEKGAQEAYGEARIYYLGVIGKSGDGELKALAERELAALPGGK